MYYDEPTRSFNWLSGLALGALVGAGLTLLVTPRRVPRFALGRAARVALPKVLTR